ncbi:MAG TPA: HAMP domain-containing sensor histidine kinase, partial [Flavisolibacter sp.]|nr:HAMP domain-containing sensor histidine kinase [Flavisolibacter sp.]
MDAIFQKLEQFQSKLRSLPFGETLDSFGSFLHKHLLQIKRIGSTSTMDDYERRKLGIFNQLNFFQLLTGLFIPVLGLFHHDKLPVSAWIFACLPGLTSILVMTLNHYRKFEIALLSYFILYPFFTCVVYLHGMNAGIGLHFILFGILSVFFLQDIGYMLFTVALSMISYFVLSVVIKDYIYEVSQENWLLYLLNQFFAIIFIFYGLYLIKKENTNYQRSILYKNKILRRKNIKIRRQKMELAELNSLKNKLFSVISHDLKSPMYAVRNIFRNMHQHDLPAEEIKEIIPEVLNDLNYTVSLMENLLEWAKSQMQADMVRTQELDLSSMIRDVLQLLHLQAATKKVYIESKMDMPVYALGDKDMINLVLRNLLSNAIKYTPESGTIKVGVNATSSFVEVYVQDSG